MFRRIAGSCRVVFTYFDVDITMNAVDSPPVRHVCTVECWHAYRPSRCFRAAKFVVSDVMVNPRFRCHRCRSGMVLHLPSRTRCWSELGIQFLGRKRPSKFDLGLHKCSRLPRTPSSSIPRWTLEVDGCLHTSMYGHGTVSRLFPVKPSIGPIVQHQTAPDAFHCHTELVKVFRAWKVFSQTRP